MASHEEHRWTRYYDAVAGRPPRATLLQALTAFEQEGRPPGLAVDLGAGTGRDSLELLRRGWRVVAIDAQPKALEILGDEAGSSAALERRCERFEEITALPACRLVNASFSLPLCPPDAFLRLWQTIRNALEPGGRLAGQLLGPADDWAGTPGVTAFSTDELTGLLEGWQVEHREEERRRGRTAKGRDKHWHLHHLVLRRGSGPSP